MKTLLLATLLMNSAMVMSQDIDIKNDFVNNKVNNNHCLHTKLSPMDVENVSIVELIEMILGDARKKGCVLGLAYLPNQTDSCKISSFHIENSTLMEAIEIAVRDTKLTYVLMGDLVILVKSSIGGN